MAEYSSPLSWRSCLPRKRKYRPPASRVHPRHHHDLAANNFRRPIRKFGGVIKEKASESTPWWPPRVVPPKGAPNVLLIMTDDSGFGAPGTFGGVVPTPAMDRIAKNGLRYTNFHSTSLCSPSRSAIITGPQPSLERFRGRGRDRDGVPGLRLDHSEGERHHR